MHFHPEQQSFIEVNIPKKNAFNVRLNCIIIFLHPLFVGFQMVIGILGVGMLTVFSIIGLLSWHDESKALAIAVCFMIIAVFGLGWNGVIKRI